MAVALLINNPFWNKRPDTAVVTAGTAKPSAQGQVMINTAAAMFRDIRKSCEYRYHQTKLSADRICTPGAYSCAALSAIEVYFDRPLSAMATSWEIFANDVSWPTAVARNSKGPVKFTSPARNSDPMVTNSGRVSPVKMDRSISDCPWITTPSNGILAPVRRMTVSPTCTCDMGTVVS